jgi:hypothetical protein
LAIRAESDICEIVAASGVAEILHDDPAAFCTAVGINPHALAYHKIIIV